MPHPVWKHDCGCQDRARHSSRPTCDGCGASGVRDGWGLSVIEHYGQYEQQHGLSALGDHKSLSRRLLAGLRRSCARCHGSGWIGDGDEDRRRCPTCEGGGGAWVAPEAELVRAYREILSAYPEAWRPGPLSVLPLLPDDLEVLP